MKTHGVIELRLMDLGRIRDLCAAPCGHGDHLWTGTVWCVPLSSQSAGGP